MHIKPYESVDTLKFGVSTKEDCVTEYGAPNKVRMSRDNEEECHYDDLIVRFDKSTQKLRECTLLPVKSAVVAAAAGEIPVTWNRDFLLRACQLDGNPVVAYGFVILPTVGIALTGLHDGDSSQVAVTVFCRGDFDAYLNDAVRFEVPV